MKSDDVKISVIVPMFNAEKYISRCLNSLIQQSFGVHEIVVIDDGSTDGSRMIVEELRKNNSNICLFSQKNKRAAAARNHGIKRSTGTHIAFVDADDYVHPDYFKILVNNLVEANAQVSMCDFYESSKDVFDFSVIKEEETRVKSGFDILYDCCANDKTAVVCPWGKIYKKELFEGITYPEGRTYEDLATTHKVLFKADRIVITSLKLYCYFKTPQSVVHGTYSKLNFDSENMAQDERLVFYGNLDVPDLILKNIIAVERNRITNYCRAMLFLDDKSGLADLRSKYINTYYDAIKQYDMSVSDRVMLGGFIIAPWFYVYVLYKLYLLITNFQRKKYER